MISDEKFAVSQELMEQAYDYLKDGYEQALNALEEAEAENTKLRKELEAEHALAETLGHHHEYIQAENAKLRELVKSMYFDLTNMTFPPDWVTDYKADMRELGLGVE